MQRMQTVLDQKQHELETQNEKIIAQYKEFQIRNE